MDGDNVSNLRALLPSAVAGILLTTLPVPPAGASAPQPAEPPAAAAPTGSPGQTSSIVVKMTDGKPPTAAEVKGLATSLGTEVVGISPMANGYARVDLANRMSTQLVAQAADSLEQADAIVTAEVDGVATADQAAPNGPNDPLFLDGKSQWALWDASAAGGGYSVRAPVGWLAGSRGSASVVVAVLDTGTTIHSDLPGALPGYDFVSPDAIGADANPGRDTDPSDPGDFCTSTQEGSDWHGTHVAGMILARTDNGVGVAGIAPGVSYEPVRVLGRCGGVLSDVADAIAWASGGSVPGVPANAHPAQVLNVSLGGLGTCPSYLATSISGAIARGSNVVVSAGKNAADAAGEAPANCPGVTAVASTGRTGERAAYSNFGSIVTLAAPGGTQTDRIVSTGNASLTTPGAESYVPMMGTSMAAPQVSGALALLRSVHPEWTADQAVTRLSQTAAPFSGGNLNNCTTLICGAGIVDIGNALYPRAGTRGSISGWLLDDAGHPRAGISVSAVDAASGLAAASATTGSDGGFALPGLNPGVYGVAFDPAGANRFYWPSEYTLNPRSAVRLDSAGVVVLGRKNPSAPSPPTGFSVSMGDARLDLNWTAPAENGGSPITGYKAAASAPGAATGTCSTTGATSCSITGLTNYAQYTVQVVATNKFGDSPPAAASGSPGGLLPPGTARGTIAGAPVAVAVTTPRKGTVNLAGVGSVSLQAVHSGSRGLVSVTRGGVLAPQSGQFLRVGGPGFAPNSAVTGSLLPSGPSLGSVQADATGRVSDYLMIPGGLPTANRALQLTGKLTDGRDFEILLGVTFQANEAQLTATSDSLAAASSKRRGKLTLAVFPMCKKRYVVTFQRQVGAKWRTLKKSKTRGAYQLSGVSAAAGSYRARISRNCGLPAFFADSVTVD